MNARIPDVAGRTLLFFLLLVLAGCAGGATAPGAARVAPQWPGVPVGPDVTGLPPVETLPGRTLAFTEASLMREGDEFEGTLANNHVAGTAGDATFSPSGSGKARADLAFAVYGFGVEAYNRDATLRLSWSAAPIVGTAYIAVANFATGRWDWQPLPATNVLDLSDLASYTGPAPNFNFYAAVLVTDGAGAVLDRIRVGTQPTPGSPNADLHADALSGGAPLLVNFDASASAAAPPATVVKYEFDAGEGGGFADLGLTVLFSHTYSASGSYNAVLRVTDVFGATDTASVTITVGDPPTAVLATTGPASGAAPFMVSFDATASTAVPPATLIGYEMDYGEGAGWQPSSSTPQHTYFIPGTYDAQVRVRDSIGATATAGVTITVTGTALYDERENNDTPATANVLPMLINGYRGSHGTGGAYEGYDGDDSDYYSMLAFKDQTLQFKLHCSSATGEMQLTLLDESGNAVAGPVATAAGEAQLDYTNPIVGGTTFALLVDSPDGAHYGDYTLDTSIDRPTAHIAAAPLAGPAPLSVTLDASGSTAVPSRTISQYEFDPEGDGSYLAPQAGPTLATVYAVPGNYPAAVRIMDNGGTYAYASLAAPVVVGLPYEETEDNDSEPTANALPALPVLNYRGSIGAPGYDGDNDDWFQFNEGGPGDELRVELDFDPALGSCSIMLLDGNGAALDSDFQASGHNRIDTVPPPGSNAPYKVWVNGFGGGSDYTLRVKCNAPTAALAATPGRGNPTLNVDLDASGSAAIAPESIAVYEFDPEGDGSYLPPQAGATLNCDYAAPGRFSARVRVTDSAGQTDEATADVIVGMDEHEDNDTQGTAELLPALPVVDFRASLGQGPGYPEYDGDGNDWYVFNGAAPGDVVRLTLDFDSGSGLISLLLYNNSASSFLGSTTGSLPHQEFEYTVQPGDALPLKIYATDNSSGYSDYRLGVQLNPPTAVLTASPFNGAAPLLVTLDATGSLALGPRNIVSYEFDPEGDGSFSVPQPGPVFNFSYSAGHYSAAVRVTDDAGGTGIAQAFVAAGQTYDEAEDNDAFGASQALPSLPVTGFLASMRSGVGYLGYDGDTSDYFSFNASVGSTVTITLSHPLTPGREMNLALYDSAVTPLESGNGSGGSVTVQHLVTAFDIQPFMFIAFALDNYYGDYTIDISEAP